MFLAVNHREPPSLFVKSCGLPKVAPQHNPIIFHHQVMPVSAPASAGSLPGAHGFVDLSSDTRWKSCSPGSKREMSPIDPNFFKVILSVFLFFTFKERSVRIIRKLEVIHVQHDLFFESNLHEILLDFLSRCR